MGKIAEMNDMRFVRWAREERGLKWDKWFSSAAAEIGEGIAEGTLRSPHDDICHDGGLAGFFKAYEALVNDDLKGKHVLCL